MHQFVDNFGHETEVKLKIAKSISLEELGLLFRYGTDSQARSATRCVSIIAQMTLPVLIIKFLRIIGPSLPLPQPSSQAPVLLFFALE